MGRARLQKKLAFVSLGLTIFIAAFFLIRHYAYPATQNTSEPMTTQKEDAKTLVDSEANGSASGPETKDPIPDSDSQERYRTAVQLLDSGKWQESEPILIALLREDPSNTKVLNDLITLNSIDKKNHAQALGYCENLMRVDPGFPFIFDRYRELASLHGDFERSISFLVGLGIGDESLQYNAPLAIARLYEAQTNHVEAIKWYRQAAALPSNEKGKIHELLGGSLMASGDWIEAEASLEQAVESHSEYNKVHSTINKKDFQSPTKASHSLVRAYVQNRKFYQADALLHKLLKVDSQNGELLDLKRQVLAGLKEDQN